MENDCDLMYAAERWHDGPPQRFICPPAELGVEGELAWLPWAEALVALTAVLAAYMLASSWNFPMFFLYRIRLFPNQLDTCSRKQTEVIIFAMRFSHAFLSSSMTRRGRKPRVLVSELQNYYRACGCAKN